MLPIIGADELHACTGQICGRGDHVSKLRFQNGAFNADAVDGHIIGGIFDFSLVHAHSGGGICLGVKVAEQHLFAQIRQGRRQVHRRSGFAHAALLVYDGYDFSHFSLLSFSAPECFT